jgi:hypothetical protein
LNLANSLRICLLVWSSLNLTTNNLHQTKSNHQRNLQLSQHNLQFSLRNHKCFHLLLHCQFRTNLCQKLNQVLDQVANKCNNLHTSTIFALVRK